MAADRDRADGLALARASEILGRHLRMIRPLSGGEHARTLVAGDDVGDVVVRCFPPGDPAGGREAADSEMLRRLRPLVPRLLAVDGEFELGSLLVTEFVDGTPPRGVSDEPLATGLARALAQIHALPGAGLRRVPERAPEARGPVSIAAHQAFAMLPRDELVLTHYDFWIGNTLWRDDQLVSVVDWSGARQGPRGVDLAWLRLDLILQGRPGAADLTVREYEHASRVEADDLAAWDLQAAAQAEEVVETWSSNYIGIGLVDLGPAVLRARLDAWSERLLRQLS